MVRTRVVLLAAVLGRPSRVPGNPARLPPTPHPPLGGPRRCPHLRYARAFFSRLHSRPPRRISCFSVWPKREPLVTLPRHDGDHAKKFVDAFLGAHPRQLQKSSSPAVGLGGELPETKHFNPAPGAGWAPVPQAVCVGPDCGSPLTRQGGSRLFVRQLLFRGGVWDVVTGGHAFRGSFARGCSRH